MAKVKDTVMLLRSTMAGIMLSLLLWQPFTMAQTVKVASMELPPYLELYDDNGTKRYDGFIKDVLDDLSKITGLTFTLHTNAIFGKKENGSWTGLVGDVVSGKVDMVAAPLTVTSERSKDVRWSTPFQNFGPVIVLRRPSFPQPSFQERFKRLFAPLSHSVWLLSLLAYFITGVVLYVVCHFNPYEWRRLYRDRLATLREAESFTCMNAFWFALSTWMWQGYTRAPRSLGGRVVVTSWWLFVTVFLVTYTASLTNLLRVGPTPLEDEKYVQILGLEDLAKQQEVEFGFVGGGSTESYFKNAQVPYLRRIWDDVMKKGHTLTVGEGMERVRRSPDSSPFAFIMESAMARYMLRQKPCDLYMVGDLTITGSYALAFRPGWALAHRLDIALLQMRENGLFKVLEDKWFSGTCNNNVLDPTLTEKIKVAPFYAVTLGSFSGVLVVLLAGVFLGALVTLLEVCVFKKAEMSSDDEASTPMKRREEGASSLKGDKNAISAGGSGTDNMTDV